MHSYWFYFVYSFCYVLEEKKAFSLSLVQISGGAITNKGTVRISADINFKQTRTFVPYFFFFLNLPNRLKLPRLTVLILTHQYNLFNFFFSQRNHYLLMNERCKKLFFKNASKAPVMIRQNLCTVFEKIQRSNVQNTYIHFFLMSVS